MWLNLIYIIIILLLALIFMGKDTPKNRKVYIFICSLTLLLGPSLRSLDYGVLEAGLDTHNYHWAFHEYSTYSITEILEKAYIRYFGNGGEESDIGYIALCNLIGLFTDNFHVYTFLALLLFFIPFGVYLYRHANNITNIAFAFIFYVSLVSIYSMGGARQLFAVGASIATLLLYEDKKYKLAIITFLIGLSLHFSMLLMLIPVALDRLSPEKLKTVHLLAFLVFPLVFLMPNQIILFLANLIGSSKYAAYGMKEEVGGANTFIFLLEIMSLFTLITIKKDSIGRSIPKVIYAMLPCLSFFGPLIHSNGSMIRITLYFFIYMTFLIPIAVKEKVSFRLYKKVVWALTIALILLTLKGGYIPYNFYWEVDPVSMWK